MITISITDSDIVYPIKTLTAAKDGLTFKEKMAFLDQTVKELKEDLQAMLFGTASVYDDYYDGEADTYLEKTEIA